MDEMNYLEHYGVKGMRWGVRKAREKSSGVRRKKASTKPKRRVRDMSDEELRKAISRLEMEKKYKELTTPQKSKGQSFVNKVLTKSGEDIATQFASYALGTSLNNLAGKDIVDPKLIQKKKK